MLTLGKYVYFFVVEGYILQNSWEGMGDKNCFQGGLASTIHNSTYVMKIPAMRDKNNSLEFEIIKLLTQFISLELYNIYS